MIRSQFGTSPQLIHAPDCSKNPYWDKLCRVFLNRTKTVHNCHDLTVLTWNNRKKGAFERSLEIKGIPHIITGQNDNPWSNYNKFKYNIQIARECGTKYLMGCDSHDVLFIGDPCEVVDRFSRMDCRLLFNCEKFFYPNFPEPTLQRWRSFEMSVGQRPYQFLNAGMWIGETDFCQEFFQHADAVRVYDLFDCEPYEFLRKSSIGCDQSSLHHIFPHFHPRVSLDYRCEVFLNISNARKDELTWMHPLL